MKTRVQTFCLAASTALFTNKMPNAMLEKNTKRRVKMVSLLY